MGNQVILYMIKKKTKQLLLMESLKWILLKDIWYSQLIPNMRSKYFIRRYLGKIQISKNKFVMADLGVIYFKNSDIFIGEVN